MKVTINSIDGRGDAFEEKVWLEVLENANLEDYIISDTTYAGDGKISNKLRHVYWFAGREVKRGDFVILHTGKGTDEPIRNNRGTTNHHIYWNLERPIWNNDQDRATLFEVIDWITKKQ